MKSLYIHIFNLLNGHNHTDFATIHTRLLKLACFTIQKERSPNTNNMTLYFLFNQHNTTIPRLRRFLQGQTVLRSALQYIIVNIVGFLYSVVHDQALHGKQQCTVSIHESWIKDQIVLCNVSDWAKCQPRPHIFQHLRTSQMKNIQSQIQGELVAASIILQFAY
ncbi:Hypothetical_protein [Hexamita inflata]|uniref:Hypothetical_protein n=1 Tax=Hexamita inflata TaxID=28002 RepID=A0AA86VEK2_9EUKA|nr:Hypothetical protein HINF_LOCUS52023 [Hexamita inflata]